MKRPLHSDTARYLALRCRTGGGVDHAIQVRGAPLYEDAGLAAPSFVAGCDPALFVPPDTSPRARAHELGHWVLWENTSSGIEYGPDDFVEPTEEEACDRFAAALLERT